MSDQPSLFDSDDATERTATAERLHLPDADVVLFDRFFSRAESDRLFAQLRSTTNWRQETGTFYGRTVPVPRLTAWHGDPGCTYTYSKIEMEPEPWTPALREIKDRIEAVSTEQFNSVLLNLYRHGMDGVAWHSDDEPELGSEPAIGSVSFGETRRFALRHKHGGHEHSVDLTHGSYLLMRGTTQRYWLHQVPKTSRKVGARVNLTFRRIEPRSPVRA